MTAIKWIEGEPKECDGSAWDRLPPLIYAKKRDRRILAGNRRPLTATRRNRIMASKANTTAERARQLLDYNPETGDLIWRFRTPDMFEDSVGRTSDKKCNSFNARFGGKNAGYVTFEGYINVLFDRKHYPAHRLIWLIVFGKLPEDEIDHRNGKRSDNSLRNLREADRSVNMQNKTIGRNNTSGHVGVYWHKPKNNWRAVIRKNSRRIYLGGFKNIEDAAAAYLAAKKKYHQHQPVPREDS